MMEESVDIGGREGGRGRAKDVTMLRIDHSDVYIENERLNEDLSFTIDTIHRSRYQKIMSRDTEINELRQSLLAMRKISSRGTSALKKPKITRSPQRLKAGVNFLSKKDSNRNVNKNKSQGDMDSYVSRNSSSTPSTIKSIEVRMPFTKIKGNKNKIVEENGKEDEESESELSSDDDVDGEDGLEEHSNSSEADSVHSINTNNKTNNFNRKPESLRSPGISSSSINSNCNLNKKEIQTKRIDPLTRIMSRLNLDKLPPSWYTEVVPASDVHVSRRVFLEGNESHNSNKRNNMHKRPKSRKMRKMTSYIRPATTGGDIFRQNSKLPLHKQESQSHLLQQSRPFTSAGVRSWVEDSGEQRPKSRIGTTSKLKNGSDSERPQSVLFCEQALHGSKTMRQLKEEEMQSAILNTQSPIDILLEEAREEQKVIDKKVRLFVKSLEEKKRSERLKRLMSESNLIKTSASW